MRGGAHSIRKKAKARKPRPILPGFGAGGSGQLQRRHFLPGRAVSLFDHLVGAREQRRRNFEAERPGGPKIDEEFELGRLFNRSTGSSPGLVPFKSLST